MSLVLGFFICIVLLQCLAAYLELRPYLRGPWHQSVMRVFVTLGIWTLLGLIIPVYLVSNLHAYPELSEVIASSAALLSFEFLALMAIGLGIAKVSGPGLKLGGLLSLAAWLSLLMLQILLIHQSHSALQPESVLNYQIVTVMSLEYEICKSKPKSSAIRAPTPTGHLRIAHGMTAVFYLLLLSGKQI